MSPARAVARRPATDPGGGMLRADRIPPAAPIGPPAVNPAAPAAPPRSRVRSVPSPPPTENRPAWREDVVTLHGVPWDLYVELSDRPDRLRSERFTFDEGLLEIVTRGGDLPPGDWREQFVRLEGVPGQAYLDLLAAEGNEHAYFTYSDGVLEIEVPNGFPHENVAELLKALVVLWVVERNIEFRPTGSADLVLRNLPRGLRGDSSYYVRNVAAVAGRGEIDLDAGDPPPDLAVEVVFSSPLNRKEEVYAALGVGELWVWRDDALTVRTLAEGGDYAPAADSPNLPGFPFALAADLIARRDEVGQTELLRRFREAVRPAADPTKAGGRG